MLVSAGEVEVCRLRIGEPEATQERGADPAPEPVLRRVEPVVDDHGERVERGIGLRDQRLAGARPRVVEPAGEDSARGRASRTGVRLQVPEPPQEVRDPARCVEVAQRQGREPDARPTAGQVQCVAEANLRAGQPIVGEHA